MNFNVVEGVHCDGQRYISFDDLHMQRDLRRDRIGSRCRADGVADRGGNTPARRGERIYLTGRPIYAWPPLSRAGEKTAFASTV